jgi:hypothetical protein
MDAEVIHIRTTTSNCPIRSISILPQRVPLLILAVGNKLSIGEILSSAPPREVSISNTTSHSLIVPISSAAFLFSNSHSPILGFDADLNRLHSLDITFSDDIIDFMFYPPECVLYCKSSESICSYLLSGQSWILHWTQQSPPARFISRSRQFVFGASASNILKWDCETGVLINSFNSTHPTDIFDLKCSEERLFTVSLDGTVNIWDVSDHNILCTLKHSEHNFFCLEIDNSSLFVLSSEHILWQYQLTDYHLVNDWHFQSQTDSKLFLKIIQNILIVADDTTIIGVPSNSKQILNDSSSPEKQIPKRESLRSISTPSGRLKRQLRLPSDSDSLFPENPHSSLSISRLKTPTFQKRKPPEKRQPSDKRQRLPILRSTESNLRTPEVGRTEIPSLPSEQSRPKTVTPFCKKSFFARLDCLESGPRAIFGLSYTNGCVLPSLHNLMEPHLGVIYSIIRDGYICNLFTAKDQKLTDLSAIFPRAELFYDLLNGETEISQRLLRRSPLLRNRALGSIGEEQPLEKFLGTTPSLCRIEIEDFYLEDRKQFLQDDVREGIRDEQRVLGDCFPYIWKIEFNGETCNPVQDTARVTDVKLKTAGFSVLERLLRDSESEQRL